MGASDSTQKSTTTTGINNPTLNGTISELAKGISDAYSPGASIYVPPSAATQSGWASSLAAAGNPAFAGGVNSAISDFADIAAGKRFGTNDPGYATLRQNTINDTLKSVNDAFSNANLFGSDANVKAASEGVGNAIAGLDYGNFLNDRSYQQQAVPLLSQLFSAGQLPGSIQQSVGASQQADQQAKLTGPLDFIGRASGALQGIVPAAGTTTTSSTPTTPLWQSLLGLGIAAL